MIKLSFQLEFVYCSCKVYRHWAALAIKSIDIKYGTNDSLFIYPGYFDEVAWMAEGRMKAELARQVWGLPYFYPIVNDVFDTTLDEAQTLWDAVDRLGKLAAGTLPLEKASKM